MGLLVLPVSRNSIWTEVFAISWDNLILYHKYLGAFFLLLVFMHGLCWSLVFKDDGSFSKNIFAIPAQYHADNFTVPLAEITSVLMVFFMGMMSWPSIRRWNYDLFYWAHHFFVVVFFVVLWHAVRFHDPSFSCQHEILHFFRRYYQKRKSDLLFFLHFSFP